MSKESQRITNLLGRKEAQRVVAVTSPADLNKRITIQYQTKVSDGMGGFVTSWVDQSQIWAAIWPLSANETVQANATVMVITGRIRIRYRTVFKSSWRIKYGNRFFNIVSVLNVNEANEYLDLMVKEAA
jgi:SPP1 family predicted phage head-tail adaptor